MSRPEPRRLCQQAAIAVVFSYALMAGGTLNGLALYRAVTVSLVLLGLVAGAWLGWAWVRRRSIAFSPVTIAYGLYLMAYAVATVFSLDPRRSLNALCLTGVYALVWVLLSDLLSKGWAAESFVRVMVVVGSAVIAAAVWQAVRYEMGWLALGPDMPILPPMFLRPNPFLTHANMVAAFLNLLWPLVLVKALTAFSWPRRIISACWVLLAWLVILLNSSRGAWLGAAAAAVVSIGLCWLAGRDRALRLPSIKLLRFSATRLAAGVVILCLVAAMAMAAGRVLQSTDHAPGLGSRLHFWQVAWEAFAANPVFGLGPDGYASVYTRRVSIPPHPLFVRAHNQYLHLLAENGLLGVLTGGLLLLAVAWAGWRRWREATVAERRLFAGVIGGLAATAVHGLFDTPPAVPVNALIIAAWAAFVTTQPQPAAGQRQAVWWRSILTLVLVVLLAVGAWTQTAYQPYVHGVALANTGSWEVAVPELELAVSRDPGHALYHLVSGYANGVLADRGEAGALSTAIERYEAAIEREPGYGLNYANMAALYWQQGDTAAATSAIEQAVALAPEAAVFWLNLGLYREETGDSAGAREAYDRALILRRSWADAYYWRANAFRQTVLAEWQAAHPSQAPVTTAGAAAAVLEAGRHEEALLLYDRALAADPRWAAGYAGRAEAALALGRYAAAERDARIAAFISDLDPVSRIRSGWVLAQLAHRRGDLDTALALGEQALDAYRHQSVFGPGTYGSSIYGWAVFYRVGLVADVLPQVEIIRFPDQQVTWLETVGGWYEEAGDAEAARRLYEEATTVAPDAIGAKQRLRALGEP